MLRVHQDQIIWHTKQVDSGRWHPIVDRMPTTTTTTTTTTAIIIVVMLEEEEEQ